MANLFQCGGGGNPNLRYDKATKWVQCKDTNGSWVNLYQSDVFPIAPLGAAPGETWDFAYKGAVDKFIAPCNGIYQLEVWGSRGGHGDSGRGGNGGYSIGYIYLNSMEELYVCCGGIGQTSQNNGGVPGGYNGGGTGAGFPWWPSYANAGGGGGATHIARTTGLLTAHASTYKDTLLIVAGGGGGAYGGTSGSAGGGLAGLGSYPGTQTGGGGVFGAATHTQGSYAGGGGGGFYGGDIYSGGSGYIDGVPAFNAPSGTYYTPETTVGANAAAGKAKITLVSYS